MATAPTTEGRARSVPARANETAVRVDGLTKRYGRRIAVNDVTFEVPCGSVTGLIGPNGAGKTTLMAMLLGLVHPTSGTGSVVGHPLDDPAAYIGRVGALIEGPAFHPAVSGADNLRALAVLGGHDVDQVPGLLELAGLGDRGDDRYGTYSLGMKQRLGIASALLGDPELVILDEPTNGLDPAGMQDIRRLIRQIAVDGRTVIVSSHLLGELEQLCTWLVVIDHGGLLHLGTPDGLAGRADEMVLRTERPEQTADLEAIVTSAHLATRTAGSDLVVVLDGDVEPAQVAGQINRRAHAAGIVLTELHHRRADLEARYLNLIDARPDTTGDLR